MTYSKIIYLGVKGSVVAIDPGTGMALWSTSLKGVDFVNVVLDGNNVFAATKGELFCLDPETGEIRWHNPLKGYGFGLIMIAGEGLEQNVTAVIAEKHRHDQQQAEVGSASAAS